MTRHGASDWLASRILHPPEQLRRRVEAMIGDAPAEAEPADVLADAAARELRRIVAGGDYSRASANDLLAVDALVTYACEAAAERWESGGEPAEWLLTWCDSLARRLSDTASAGRAR